MEEYRSKLGALNMLTYFKQPQHDLAKCVGIEYNGKLTTGLKRILIDGGANVHIMSERTARQLGIPWGLTSIRLTTSNEQTTTVLGITPAVQVVYGVGTMHPLRVHHFFLVTKGMHSLYEILLGNLDTQIFGGSTDAGEQTHTLRPQFPVIGLDSRKLTLPTVNHSPQAQ
jgi:hypothetical protein